MKTINAKAYERLADDLFLSLVNTGPPTPSFILLLHLAIENGYVSRETLESNAVVSHGTAGMKLLTAIFNAADEYTASMTVEADVKVPPVI